MDVSRRSVLGLPFTALAAPAQQTPPVKPPQFVLDQIRQPNPMWGEAHLMAARMLEFEKKLTPLVRKIWNPKVSLERLPGAQSEKETASINHYRNRYMNLFGKPENSYLLREAKEQGVDFITPFVFAVGHSTGWVDEMYGDEWLKHLLKVFREDAEKEAHKILERSGRVKGGFHVRVEDKFMERLDQRVLSKEAVPPSPNNPLRRQLVLDSMKVELAVILDRPQQEIQFRCSRLRADMMALFRGARMVVTPSAIKVGQNDNHDIAEPVPGF